MHVLLRIPGPYTPVAYRPGDLSDDDCLSEAWLYLVNQNSSLPWPPRTLVTLLPSLSVITYAWGLVDNRRIPTPPYAAELKGRMRSSRREARGIDNDCISGISPSAPPLF